jgi:hypothetical protein
MATFSYSVRMDIPAEGPLRMLFYGTKSEVRELCGEALESAAVVMRDAVRTNVAHTFGGRGWRRNPERDKERGLYPESIVHETNKRSLVAIIRPTTISGALHELGTAGLPDGVIKPKRGKYLTWIENEAMSAHMFRKKEAGGWRVFVKSVKIPARPYLEPASRTALPAATEAAKATLLRLLGA